MSDSVHIVCPSCNRTNKVPAEKVHARPLCGSCHDLLFSARPLDLTTMNFYKHVRNSHIPVLVDFWAPWCGPCKMTAPVMEQAAAQLEPRTRVAKVNTEDEQGLASSFDIRSIPTMILFRGGTEIARQSGAMDLGSLTAWVASVLR